MQRVAVSRALSQNPRLILADEPTRNLDTRSGQEVLAMLRDAVRDQNRCMLMVTHDPKVAAFADRIVTITDGKIISYEKQSHALTDRAASS